MASRYKDYDFCGYATKANIKCSDGRTILPDAFKEQDGEKVPLCWGHKHDSVEHVLGHAYLENRADGVYAYGYFNDTESGRAGRELVNNGDISALSIWANKLKQTGSNVVHGCIRELSLVLAGANPGAYIDSVVQHEDGSDEEAEITFILDKDNIQLAHAEEEIEEESEEEAPIAHEDTKEEENQMADEKTVQDVIDSMNEEQKNVLYALVGEALANENTEEETDMKHNLFDNETEKNTNVLSHDEMATIINDAKRLGSMKESFLAHAQEYGIENIEYLFPEARTLTNTPEFIKRDMGWVDDVMNAVHKTPFSRIKSVFADIREDEARAKGYIKGNLKKEEVFSLLKRTTTPCTVYKKQKLDRDDVVDITDFDVVAWIKTEMRMMLNEELARAFLIGDGRLASDDDHISTDHIRPVYSDAALYTVQKDIEVTDAADEDGVARAFIRGVRKARKDYKGSGNPTLYTTEDMVTNCLLLEDAVGRLLYDTEEALARAMRVKKIVTVPVMENMEGVNGNPLIGIMVNLTDYNVGADKGGAVNMFDDFDIDYNQMKYLMETRCSGALIKPYSAVAFELNAG